jgi:hypothetical protein
MKLIVIGKRGHGETMEFNRLKREMESDGRKMIIIDNLNCVVQKYSQQYLPVIPLMNNAKFLRFYK